MRNLRKLIAILLVTAMVITSFIIFANSRSVTGVIIGPTPLSELTVNENPDMLYKGESYFNVAIRDRKTGKDTIVHAVNTFPYKKRLPGQRVMVTKFMNGGEYLIQK